MITTVIDLQFACEMTTYLNKSAIDDDTVYLAGEGDRLAGGAHPVLEGRVEARRKLGLGHDLFDLGHLENFISQSIEQSSISKIENKILTSYSICILVL